MYIYAYMYVCIYVCVCVCMCVYVCVCVYVCMYTANSIKVDIDNSQMFNMIDRVPKERFFTCMPM